MNETTIRKAELRFSRVSVADPRGVYSTKITGPEKAAAAARVLYGDSEQEAFLVFFLDIKNKVTGYTEAARGGQSNCGVDPRVIFRAALLAGAEAVILIHNHPSGDTTPSTEDLALTRRLRDAGNLVGIPVLDHVIVTDTAEVSLREIGNW